MCVAGGCGWQRAFMAGETVTTADDIHTAGILSCKSQEISYMPPPNVNKATWTTSL